MGDRDEPPVILLRHHPRPLHQGLGRDSAQRQEGLRQVSQDLLRAGPERPLDAVGAVGLPAAAEGDASVASPALGLVLAGEASPGLRQEFHA